MSDRDYDIQLPTPLPDQDVVVDREEHEYIVNEGTSGSKLPQDEYLLDKAPVDRIETVTGRESGDTITFTKGADYELSDDGNRLVWQDNRRPDDNSKFYVTYTAPSVISRFNESVEGEMHTIDHFLQEIQDSKFIESAEGDELDEIGKLFGDNLGKRRGRDDSTYRLYLRSVVQSVISRGTVPDIKEALSAATGIATDDIEVEEDFTNVEYDLVLDPTSSLRGSTIEDIAEVADPSGVELNLIKFLPEEEQVAIQDRVDFSIGNIVPDEMAVDDALTVNDNLTTTADDMTAADAVGVNDNLATIADQMAADDATTIDGNLTTTTDTAYMDDDAVARRNAVTDTTAIDDGNTVLPRDINTALWEEQDRDHTTEWDFFEWTELIDLTTTSAETLGLADAVTVPPKDAIVADDAAVTDAVTIPAPTTTSDTAGINDTVEIIFNQTSVTDTGGSADATFIDRNETTTTDTGGSADTVANVGITQVAWESGDWETMEWAIEHN